VGWFFSKERPGWAREKGVIVRVGNTPPKGGHIPLSRGSTPGGGSFMTPGPFRFGGFSVEHERALREYDGEEGG